MLIADDLQFFLEVARTGRLVTAARTLGVDHTTVGRRITHLERTLGTRLFNRKPTGWTMTDAGNTLVVHAKAAESAVLAAVEELSSSAGHLSGTVRFVTPSGFGVFVLLPELRTVREDYPALTVEVVTASGLNALASLTDREFDVGVTLDKPLAHGLDAYPLAEYWLRMYATVEYLESHAQVESVRDLYHHDLIGYVDAMLDIPALRMLDEVLPRRHHLHIQTNNISGQWMAAVAGLGIALLPQYIGEPDPRLVCVLGDSVCVTRRYWMVVPRELQRLARTRVAQAVLRASVNAHPYIYSLLLSFVKFLNC